MLGARTKDLFLKSKRVEERSFRTANAACFFATLLAVFSSSSCDKTGFFKSFPYVCPEPVLVKR
jgi:hypothetical protein